MDTTADSFIRETMSKSQNAQSIFEKSHYDEILAQARKGLAPTALLLPARVKKNLLHSQASGNSVYFSNAERDVSSHWEEFILPYLPSHADFTYVLEIASGHGRNIERFLNYTSKIVGIDINEDNIQFLRDRFSTHPQLSFHKNDGLTLPREIQENISFVFCFDAMVQFDKEVVSSYLKEMSRVMAKGAFGFLHHSQTPECPLTLSNGFCSRPESLGEDIGNPHQRNANSKENVALSARNYYFDVVTQYDIIWDETFGVTDAITILQKI